MKDALILIDKSKIKDFVLKSEKLLHHCRMGWVELDNERWWSNSSDSYLYEGKRNKEKIAEKHSETSVPLIRGIPMEMKTDIFTALRRSSKFKSFRNLTKSRIEKNYLCPYIQISCTATVNLKKQVYFHP